MLTNIMTRAYFDDYYTSYDLEYGATELIEEFYCMHYSGVAISNDQIERIVNEYCDNIPMLILCVYLLGIEDDPDLIKLAIPNMSIVFSLIQNTYNNLRTAQELSSYSFTSISAIEVLSVINKKAIE
ncbi:hypothetical protein [Gelidibacter maritimus]|uniref:Uncharacterized protein n=1 Tax=Gelidibacter maritimus TaxID=2761487 RepID=A0A7W2M7J3_9FLAO|nr:hypothetical protein [Gelidibacter maritimus]MBA6153936.1 hypothetical protein [Gelidibacter maritimus]